jgi:glycosyltransferase involved in cell wall biosynthesis
VVDDGSTDNTKAVVVQYIVKDKRFKYIYQQNQGQSPARNNGLGKATGNYIQFLDADDLLESRKLEHQVNFLEQHPDIDILYGRTMYFIDSIQRKDLLVNRSGEDVPWMREISGKGLVMMNAFIEDNIMEFGSLLFRKQIISDIGFLDEQIQGVEDWDYCFRCALSGKTFRFEHFQDAYCLMRHHESSFSKGLGKMLRAKIKLRFKINRLLLQSGQYSQQIQANTVHLHKLLELEGRTSMLYGSMYVGFTRYFYLGLKKHALPLYLKRAVRIFKQRIQNRPGNTP